MNTTQAEQHWPPSLYQSLAHIPAIIKCWWIEYYITSKRRKHFYHLEQLVTWQYYNKKSSTYASFTPTCACVEIHVCVRVHARIPIGCCTQFSCVHGQIKKVRARACWCAQSIINISEIIPIRTPVLLLWPTFSASCLAVPGPLNDPTKGWSRMPSVESSRRYCFSDMLRWVWYYSAFSADVSNVTLATMTS